MVRQAAQQRSRRRSAGDAAGGAPQGHDGVKAAASPLEPATCYHASLARIM